MQKNKQSALKTSHRVQKEKVKTAKRRSNKSTEWLQRQLNDPYVSEAKAQGYQSRAAFKLIELNNRFNFLKSGQKIVDLGAAPGGWSQVASQKIGKSGKIVAIDILDMEPLDGVDFIKLDFTDEKAPEILKEMIGGSADVVLSDMAANTTGHKSTDHLRIIALLEMAYDFSREVLNDGGTFVAKVFQGGAESELLSKIKKDFAVVRHAKPPASRKESPETYIVASGFRK